MKVWVDNIWLNEDEIISFLWGLWGYKWLLILLIFK